ncbi:MAG: hypothetical protein J6H18_01300 [Lachnospiraceae bacterium]|nr:hypothetical protein [Lachnospiraceae bacterium]
MPRSFSPLKDKTFVKYLSIIPYEKRKGKSFFEKSGVKIMKIMKVKVMKIPGQKHQRKKRGTGTEEKWWYTENKPKEGKRNGFFADFFGCACNWHVCAQPFDRKGFRAGCPAYAGGGH